MKKIPTLFHREFDDHRVTGISPDVAPEMQWALNGEGIATEKIDGACCAMIDGVFYKRYDAKKDKRGKMKLPPTGAIPCDDPDPVTGHWPHWVKVEESNPADRWFLDALRNTQIENGNLSDATYEAIGPHFQSNPYHLAQDTLVKHGAAVIELNNRRYESIRDYLQRNAIEGIVFWKDGKPRCKIKRRDFGFKWPLTQAEIDEQIKQREMMEHFATEAEEESLRKSKITGDSFYLKYSDHTEFRLKQEGQGNENDIGTGGEGTAETE
ncbi:MAG: hypothetical protein IJI45_07395 [Anaerolineaceae bacterium]|nr:hypothetical protein [Anaerolineaceae bacterium]